MARLVQRRVLFDVIVNDFATVASNGKRQPDEKIVDIFLSLKRSPYEDIRAQAEEIKHSMLEMNRSGMQTETSQVANKKHLQELVDLLDGGYC